MYNISHSLNIQPEYIFLQPILQLYIEIVSQKKLLAIFWSLTNNIYNEFLHEFIAPVEQRR